MVSIIFIDNEIYGFPTNRVLLHVGGELRHVVVDTNPIRKLEPNYLVSGKLPV